MAAQLILGLSIIVILHEFGHYIAARSFGIRVEKFYLFFDAWNFKIFKIKIKETEYGVGWLPLGGYVKISGMIDESMDKEAMKLPPQPWEFRSKPAWQRLIVMLGGVIMNFILGVIIFAFITLHYEKQYLPLNSLDSGIYAYNLGTEIGFKTGDKIISVNGEVVERFKDITAPLNLMGSKVVVDRNGEQITIEIPGDFYKKYSSNKRIYFLEPDNHTFKVDSLEPKGNAIKQGIKVGDRIIMANDTAINVFGDFKSICQKNPGKNINAMILRGSDTLNLKLTIDSMGTTGIYAFKNNYKLEDYTFGQGVKYGWKDGVGVLAANVKGFGRIFTGELNPSESLQGPIGIATIYGSEWIWPKFWYLTGMISFILAFMNILPIPALDGGHVMFLSFEMITRRTLSDKFMERAQIVGMVILIALMVFAFGNDIWKHFIN